MTSQVQGSGLNTHAAMSPALMRDLRTRVHGTRSMERLSDLETDKRPNLILSGRRSGSFVKQRQEAFIRSTSQSSSQSSLHSPRSDFGDHNPFSASTGDINRSSSSSVNLPRIPSKTLKERGIIHVTKRTDVIRSGDVKRPASTVGEGESKIRRLVSADGRSSSFNYGKQSLSSASTSPRHSDTAVDKRESDRERVQRQDSVTSESQKSRSSITSKRSSIQSDRKSSVSSSVSSPRGDRRQSPTSQEKRHSVSRQDSAASDRSSKDRSLSGSNREGGHRNSMGGGVLQMSFTSGRSSSVKSASGNGRGDAAKWSGFKHRPSFNTIQGSSTPPRPPSELSAYPLPTPPPTPTSIEEPEPPGAHVSVATSPMSPGHLDPEDASRLTSTSTDVVLGYFDNTIAPYSSAPVTPTALRSRSASHSAFTEEEQHFEQNTSNLQTSLQQESSSKHQPVSEEDSFSHKSDPKMDFQPVSDSAPSSVEIVLTTSAGQEEEERYQAQKRRTKGGKHAKRKLTPTQVTKYEGSVKTVRRQIKPGHVEELREIFKKQSEQDEDAAVPRHGKRRMTSHRNGSSNDDDDSGSGYTTTSSDNEYDLEMAERVNSPDYPPSSPFSSPRSADYDANWEEERMSQSVVKRSSSGSSSSAGGGDGRNSSHSRPTSDLIDTAPQHDSSSTPTPSEKGINLNASSSGETTQAETVFLPFDNVSRGELTRSSSLHQEQDEKQAWRNAQTDSLPSHSVEPKSGTASLDLTTTTGPHQRDMDDSSSSDQSSDSESTAKGDSAELRSEDVTDGYDALGDNARPDAVTARLVEGRLGLEAVGGEGGERDEGGEAIRPELDTVTTFRLNEQDDISSARSETGDEADKDTETPTTLLTSQTVTSRSRTEAHTQPQHVASFDTAVRSHSSRHTVATSQSSFPLEEETAGEVTTPPQSDDFLSLLDNIQLDSESFTPSTAEKAKKFQREEFTSKKTVTLSTSGASDDVVTPAVENVIGAAENIIDREIQDVNAHTTVDVKDETDTPEKPVSTVGIDTAPASDRDDNMAAVVGELSAFMIRKKKGEQSRQSVSESSVTSHQQPSSAPSVEENAGDVYVYRDSQGDVYGLNSSDSVTVETDHVDVAKAKEVISAFFAESGDRSQSQGQGRLAQGEGVRGESSIDFTNAQHGMTSQSAHYDVMAGNVGVGAGETSADQSYGNASHAFNASGRWSETEGRETDVRRSDSGTYVSKVNVFRSDSDVTRQPQVQQFSSSVQPYSHDPVTGITVSTTSTAVVGEQSELQIKIPPSAVPVLPTRINSTNASVTSQGIAPIMIDDGTASRNIFASQRNIDLSGDQRNYDVRASQRISEQDAYGPGTSARDTRESEWSQTEYRSQQSFGQRTDRRHSGSSLSSDDGGGQARYRTSRLSRSDSHERSKPYVTSGKRYAGTVYDSANFVQQKQQSPVRFTVVSNTNNTNTSFGDNDSQYGSQTSKTTSGGDISPTDEPLYRIIRGDTSPPPVLSSAPSPPRPKHTVYSSTLDRKSRATTDYHQRELYRSREAAHRQNNAVDVWRVDRYSRSEPDLSLPLLGTTLSTFTPRKATDGGDTRYRLVHTDHSGREKVRRRSSSSDSDTDSGVGGSKLYRTVSKVHVNGSGSLKRSHSTGSHGGHGHFSLRPRSPSPPSRDYRLSKLERQASWERRKEDERSLDNSLYKIEKVSSAEDWAEKQGGRTVYRTVDSVHTSRKSGDENNNIRAYRLVHTLPSDKTVTDDGARYRASEVTAFHRSPSPAGKGFSRFDDDVSYRTRSVSPSRPPRGRSPTPPGKHRTVITLQVNKQQKTPTQQYADTDQGTAQYRVVNVRSGDDSQYSPSSQPTSGSSYYAAHNQSFPSPVSGYESDMERSTTTTSRVYNVNTSRPPRPASPAYDNYPTAADRRYVVQKTKPSSGQAVVEEERVTLREIKPRVSSPPPSVTHRSSGEWHKTTIDINRNVSTERTSQRNMAPLHQQKHKSYVVFNSMDNVRDTSRDVTSPPHPLQRSTSQTMSSDRHFRVTSPTPTSGPFQRSFRQDIFVESGRGGQRMTLPPRRERVEDETDTYRREVYEEKSYEMRSGTTNVMPEADQSQQDKDLRVLRGKILIQNRLDDSRDHDDFLDNMNVFDSSFHLGKDNPLYQSDPDIYRSLEAELQREDGQRIGQEVTQDITFEKVDKIAQRHKAGEVQLSPKPRKKQTLSALLLSKLANIDSKDIRQHIDVQHHNEEIYGDVALVHADGTRAHNANTSTFDSVNENVELMLKEGKAFVIIKVIAERIVPIDWEFNVWRKSQAIVTRNIEIDLKATEQRRRLYEHVMETAGHRGALEDSRGAGHYRQGDASSRLTAEDHERQLSSLETLRLFSQILEVADGKGEVDDTEMRTEQEMGMLPGP
ncbi:hypothetical protein BaRGS_00012381, partial [Batillaria attramentaria]